jgi:hypothetical protein
LYLKFPNLYDIRERSIIITFTFNNKIDVNKGVGIPMNGYNKLVINPIPINTAILRPTIRTSFSKKLIRGRFSNLYSRAPGIIVMSNIPNICLNSGISNIIDISATKRIEIMPKSEFFPSILKGIHTFR